MNLNIGLQTLKPLDSILGDVLAIVKVDSLHGAYLSHIVETDICDLRAVVEFENYQSFSEIVVQT